MRRALITHISVGVLDYDNKRFPCGRDSGVTFSENRLADMPTTKVMEVNGVRITVTVEPIVSVKEQWDYFLNRIIPSKVGIKWEPGVHERQQYMTIGADACKAGGFIMKPPMTYDEAVNALRTPFDLEQMYQRSRKASQEFRFRSEEAYGNAKDGTRR